MSTDIIESHFHVEEWDPILTKVRDLVPKIARRATEATKIRRIPNETIKDLFNAKVLRFFQPSRFGGFRLPWGLQFQVGRILAHGCPSTAWISTVVASHITYACRFPIKAQQEIFSNGHDVLLGMGSAPSDITLKKTQGGYKLSGRFKFVSGVDHISWILLPIIEKIGTDRQNNSLLLVPKNDIEIDDTWHVVGMKATGSKDIICDNVFVPDHRLMKTSDIWSGDCLNINVDESFIFQCDLNGYYGTGLIGPIIGAAEGGIHAYINETKRRIGSMTKDKPSENNAVQIRLGESIAEVKSARTMMELQFDFLRHCGENNLKITQEQSIEFNRDRSIATRLCLDAVERLVKQMGAMGLYETNSVQLFYQDLKAASMQIALNPDRNFQAAGKMALGLDAMPSF